MSKSNKVVFYADDALLDSLKAESTRTGAPVAELCRRACAAALKPAQIETVTRSTSTQSVLVAGK